MLYSVVFVICAAEAPAHCEEHQILFRPASPVACIHDAGPEIARVIPAGWTLAGWHCAPPPVRAGR